MALDKKAVRETIAQYQAWNEEVFASQVLEAGKKTPAEKWQEYQDLYDFAMQIKSGTSWWEQALTMEEWATYYDQIRRFEAWRQQRGKTA